MVITKLYGGLGNQMYQFAAGKSLAINLNTELIFDLSWFEEVKDDPVLTQRVYELDGFGIKPIEPGIKERALLRIKPLYIFQETHLGYLKEFESLDGNIKLDGYWQSYKYFEKHSIEIRDCFKFPQTKPQNKKTLDEIKNTTSVALHFRRGDYNTKRGKQYHGLLPTEYYKKAISNLEKKLKDPIKLFIFSDEIDWCKKNVKFRQPTVYIDSNGPNSGVEDMQLMSACRHAIIANSSFSWWAAWLNPNPKKIIYAPKAWFKKVDHQLDDRIPPDWIKL